MVSCGQLWLLSISIILVIVFSVSGQNITERSLEDDDQDFQYAYVTQHTRVNRQKRGDQTQGALDSRPFEFGDKMTFMIQVKGQLLKLDLTRNDIPERGWPNDKESPIYHYLSRIGVYTSVDNSVSVFVECHHEHLCTLYGSLEINGDSFSIEADETSDDLKYHVIRKREVPDIDEFRKSIATLPVEGEDKVVGIDARTDIAGTTGQGLVRRRRNSGIPDCDIVEFRANVDDSVWDFYLEKFGGNETLAEEGLERYLYSTFAELDFRMKCLTSYFENYDGTCGISCLRVILRDIRIDKTSSFTDGKFLTYTFPDGSTDSFPKGFDSLYKCSTKCKNYPENNINLCVCFTRHNIIIQEGGIWKDYFRSATWTPSMCNSNRYYHSGITELKGDGVPIQLAHLLLHSLNDKNKNCMRTPHGFTEAEWHDWEETPLPGEIFSTDEQCKDKWGNDSVQCDPNGNGDLFPPFMCSRYIWCTRNGSCVCKVRVSSGTPCGKAKICLKGKCEPTPDVPLGGTCDCHFQCAGNNTVCDPETCTCVCADGYYDNNRTGCVEKVPLDEACSDGFNCLDPNARCINGTCQCPPTYYNDNGHCVERKPIGGDCNRTEECIGDNVVCDTDRNKCVCDYGFFIDDCANCVRVNGTLCDPCINNTCVQADTECSESGICECTGDTIAIDGECYGTRVGDRCTNTVNTCIDDYAECNGTICDCIAGFIWNGSRCVGPNLCDPCDPNTPSCVSDLECSDDVYRCECPSDQVQVGDNCYGTRVSEPCTTAPDTCIDDNAVCNGTICDCISPFKWNGTVCVGIEPCDPCDPNDDTCDGELTCSSDTYRCECPSGRVQVGDNCYGTLVEEPCTTTIDTCVDDNAVCNGTICDCLPGFHWNGSICGGENLCDPCDPNDNTCSTPDLVCSSNTYRCECPTNEVQIADGCYGTDVGDPCLSSLDTCTDDNAGCNGTVCDCNEGYHWNGSICLGENICDPCDPSTDTCGPDLTCNPLTYRCECQLNEVQIGDECYGTRVAEECTQSTDTCIDDFAACNGTICDCLSGYHWNGSRCVGDGLCDPCDPTSNTCSTGLVCNPSTYRCECETDEVQIDDQCYGTRVTEPCTTSLNTCIDDNAECNGTVCDCIEGFSYNGTHCGGPDLCDPCDPATSTCHFPLVCSSSTYRCECPPGFVQIQDECYGRLVGESCTSDLSTCIDDNAVCNGTTCVCITGYTYNGTFCLGFDLCHPCDPLDDTCQTGLECSSETYRCECPDNEVQVGNDCYGTRVGEPCTNSRDTCIDDNAGCNGTVCDCLVGYVWNGSICLGDDLCDPCDPTITTCSTDLLCSTATYRCECQTDEVQIEDNCYGTHVGDSCTTELDTCIDDYAECNGTICDCQEGFHYNGTSCGGSNICDQCDPTASTCENGLNCSDETYRCECPAGQVQIGENCYGTRVAEPCTSSLDTCIDCYASCNGTICDCDAGYFWNGSRCNGQFLCDPCDPSDSTCDTDLECSSETYTCECPSNKVQYSDACYGTRVGEECTTQLDTCIDNYAECNGTVCDCLAGFHWNGSICGGPALCDPCDPSANSCSDDLVCSVDTYRCECPEGQVQYDDECYGTDVGDDCTTMLDTCVDDYAACNGTICDCVSPFVWNGSRCNGDSLCDPCDTSPNTCGSGLACSLSTYRCECPTDRVQVGDDCYGTRVTEPCTSEVDTCIDDNAECNGTVCDCISGFTFNGSSCSGDSLCDTCDPSSNTCGSGLECSTDTYRCECPTHQVQIGDNCYGTRIGEDCTSSLDTCTDDNAVCNGTICDCIAGFSYNGTFCLGPDLCNPCDPLSNTCTTGLECSSNTYRCECPPDQVQIGNNCYGTRVGDTCISSTDTCTDTYADCNGTICDCIAGYHYNGSGCMGEELCDPCDPNQNTCRQPGLMCSSETYRCECLDDEVQIEDECYGTRVTESCTDALSTCVDYFAECNGTVCVCIENFMYNGSHCLGQNLCEPCDPGMLTCDSELTCSSSTYRCECPPGKVQIGDECVGRLVGEDCTTSQDTCIDDNAGCNDTTCDCNDGFVWNGLICVGSNTGEPCSSDDQCSSNLVCLNSSVCGCPDDQVQIEGTCYGTRVTELCTNTLDTCVDDNAECNGTVCDCIQGFHWNGSSCGGENLCEPCDPSSLTCMYGLTCSSSTYRCECQPNEVQVGDTCVGTRVTDACSPVVDTCVDDNAECNGTICTCISQFVWNGTICGGPNLCDHCDPETPSCMIPYDCSSSTYRCECPSGEVQIEDDCYGTRIGDSCSSSLDTCIDDNAECNGTICDCEPGFSYNGTICTGTSLCDPCDTDDPCDQDLVCSPDTYRCECPTDQVQIGDNCYGTRIGEPCTPSLPTCVDKHAECNGTVCDCAEGFTYNGTHCSGQNLCDPCDPNLYTCSPGLVCSSNTYRCECPTDEVQISDACYGTRVSDQCTTVLDTCIDDNAACNGTICDCLENFSWNGSRCNGIKLCDPCVPSDSTCESDLECSDMSYRCECPSDEVQIGDECYGTLVTERCTTAADTCTDDNAECNGTVCDCSSGFSWNGTLCVGASICDPCDPSSDTCESPLDCSTSTYRCECPSNLVQIGDNCYGTLVGESCTSVLDTCVQNNADCNGTICDCEEGFTYNGTDCVGENLCEKCDPTMNTCEDGLECSTNTYRCECPPNRVQIGDNCYGTLVTEPCTTDIDTCIDDNAACNGTICDCIEGFSYNGSNCHGEDLCDSCDPSSDTCSTGLSCSSDTYRCECSPGFVQIGAACYGRFVTQVCTSLLDTCVDDNAECNGTLCDCSMGFHWNGSICSGDSLCDPCDPASNTCATGLVCSTDTYRCECNSTHVQIDDECYGTRVTEDCTNDLDTCIDDYAECNGSICNCIENYVWNGTICVGQGECDPCDPSTLACSSPFECNTDRYRCECPSDKVQVGSECVGSRVSETCSSEVDTCVDDNAECNGTVCNCLANFHWNGSICAGTAICDPCDDSTIACDDGLICSTATYRCACPADRVQIEDQCYGTMVGEPCTSSLSTCTDNNAGCNGTVCDCLQGFTYNGTICVGTELCEPCDSLCQSPLVCSSQTYRCECPDDEVQISDNCYGTHVGDACTTHQDTCIDDNAECNGTICDCISGFSWNGSRCIGDSLCESCDPGNPTCSSGLVCSATTYRCECTSGFVQIGDACYGTLVTQPCTLDVDTCIDDNAACNGTVCDCKEGFSYNGTQCNGENLCEPCDPSNPTCGSGLTCSSDTYRCECLSHQVQIGDDCYGTRIGESCTTSLDTCVDDYAECNGTVCDCIQDFKSNGSICVGQDLCDQCDSSTLACEGDLTCSTETYRCECPTNQVQIGDDCYGTRVEEPCTTDTDTCTDDNAECNGTICTCVMGSVWNGSFCGGPGLCSPCDPNTPSCDTGLVCSVMTYRCECPTDKVQIADDCYGTDIGDDCLTTLDTCVDDNAECVSGTCACSSPFTYNATLGICVGPDLDDPCDADSCGPGLTCGTTSERCECETPRVQIDNICYGTRVTENCTVEQDTCIDDYAECLAGLCACLPNFTWNGLICVGSEIDDPCDSSSCGAGLVCGPTDRCECESPQVQVNNLCYSLICDNCTNNDDCLGDHQICLNYTCQCETNYYLDNCSICQEKVVEGESCLADEECLSGICACNECVGSLDDDCCEDCEDIKADITIITDASGTSATFADILGFAATVVNAFTVSPDDVQVGIVDFAGGIDNGDSFNMDVETDNLEITREIIINNFNGGSRRTDLALQRAKSYYDSSANRAGVNNFVILLTDGQSSNPGATVTQANNLKSISDMTVFAVGIDSLAPISELQAIASDPSFAFATATTATLNTIVEEILDNSCQD